MTEVAKWNDSIYHYVLIPHAQGLAVSNSDHP